MSSRLFSEDVFRKIQNLERHGNINSVIAKTMAHYDELKPVRSELVEKIAEYFKNYHHFISPLSIVAIQNLFEREDKTLRHFGLNDLTLAQSPPIPPKKVAAIFFPAVLTSGLVHELIAEKASPFQATPSRLKLIDNVGAAVYAFLKNHLKRSLIWHPSQFFFHIHDTYGNDVLNIKGASMGLPLMLSIYSLLTNIPVPADLSATGEVKRDGTVEPINSIDEKLRVLNQERSFIKRVLISDQQDINTNNSEMELIRVKTIEDAIGVAFPKEFGEIHWQLSMDLDLDEEMSNLKKQHDAYLLDTCIENTDEIVRYLEDSRQKIPKDKAVPALFDCYWRKGSCLCHKGEIDKAAKCLKKARLLDEKNQGFILKEDYLSSQNSYAVTLKDIFRYPEAEKIHIEIHDELEKIRGLNQCKGENLSSLSQMYLAMGLFEEAEKYQKEAIPLINESERNRNYAYLAQIFVRKGAFDKAKYYLNKSASFLENQNVDKRRKDGPFLDWFLAEYFYRKGISPNARKNMFFKRLHELAKKYNDISWYVPALINKFAGFAYLNGGDEALGIKTLDCAIQYFDSQLSPILRVLGASIRAERAIYFLSTGQKTLSEKDMSGVIENLQLQTDIRNNFQSDIKHLENFLKLKKPSQSNIEYVINSLISLAKKMPY